MSGFAAVAERTRVLVAFGASVVIVAESACALLGLRAEREHP